MNRLIALTVLLVPVVLACPQAKAEYYNPYAQMYQQWNRENGYGSSQNNQYNPYNQMNQQYRQDTDGNRQYTQTRRNTWY